MQNNHTGLPAVGRGYPEEISLGVAPKCRIGEACLVATLLRQGFGGQAKPRKNRRGKMLGKILIAVVGSILWGIICPAVLQALGIYSEIFRVGGPIVSVVIGVVSFLTCMVGFLIAELLDKK